MRFYTDEDVPLELAELGRSRGFDFLTARDAGMRGRSDREQLRFAGEQGRCLITSNPPDFARLCNEFADEGLPHAGVLGARPQIQPHDVARVLLALRKVETDYPAGLPPYTMIYLRW